MSCPHHHCSDRKSSRRDIIKSAVGGAVSSYALFNMPAIASAATTAAAVGTKVPVALTTGNNRGDNVMAALRLIEPQIRKSLAGKKQVVVKPNMVVINRQLAASHVDGLEPICDFMRTLFKGKIILCDSAASGLITDGYDNYGYYRLRDRYNIEFLDIDAEATERRYVSDHRLQPQAVRMSRLLLAKETYTISAAIPKTHDRAIVTLSLKNIAVGAAKKDRGFNWGDPKSGVNDKATIHGGPNNEAIHYNLCQLARELHPDLAVLDGYQGMQGNGPVAGDPVDHKIAIASTDWLAADRVAVDLMGLEFDKIGYLHFAAKQGMGESDLSKIEVLGERMADHVKSYQPHASIEQQYEWMTRRAVADKK